MSDVAALLEEAAVKLASTETELEKARRENEQLKQASEVNNQVFLAEIERALADVAPLIGIGRSPVELKNAALATFNRPGGLSFIMAAVAEALTPAPSVGRGTKVAGSDVVDRSEVHRISLSKWLGRTA